MRALLIIVIASTRAHAEPKLSRFVGETSETLNRFAGLQLAERGGGVARIEDGGTTFYVWLAATADEKQPKQVLVLVRRNEQRTYVIEDVVAAEVGEVDLVNECDGKSRVWVGIVPRAACGPQVSKATWSVVKRKLASVPGAVRCRADCDK